MTSKQQFKEQELACQEFTDQELADQELAAIMLPLIDPQRARREMYWLQIGQALYNTYRSHKNGLNTWIQHTESVVDKTDIPDFMQNAGSIRDTCTRLYPTFLDTTLTVKTLAWYARKDSPVEYANWHQNWCLSSFQRSLSGTAEDLGNAVADKYWLDFVAEPLRWFEFHHHRWVETHGCVGLKRLISTEFNDQYTDPTIHRKLKTVGYKDRIVVEARKRFIPLQLQTQLWSRCTLPQRRTEIWSRFDSSRLRMDDNPKLMGVKNGVLEIVGNRVYFRPGIPEDYLTRSTNIPYRDDYTWEHPDVEACRKWLQQVLVDDLDAFMKLIASYLHRDRTDFRLPILTGDDSKLVVMKLIETIFGADCARTDTIERSKHRLPWIHQSIRMTFVDMTEEESVDQGLKIFFSEMDDKVKNPVLIADGPVTPTNRLMIFPFVDPVDDTFHPHDHAAAFLWMLVQSY